MEWQWSSPECATSVIEGRRRAWIRPIRAFPSLVLTLLLLMALPGCDGVTIDAGADIQKAVNDAGPGDTIVVGPGEHLPFSVDKPLTIYGHGAIIRAGEQRPGITVLADGVTLDGFHIIGVPANDASKFKYYMDQMAATPGQPSGQPMAYQVGGILRMDLPNAAIMSEGSLLKVYNLSLMGAEVGFLGKGIRSLLMENCSFVNCSLGVDLSGSTNASLTHCSFLEANKGGLKMEGADGARVEDCRAEGSRGFGVFIREGTGVVVANNSLNGHLEGLVLWSVNDSLISGNHVQRNYYGILLAGSYNNTVEGNRAQDNARSEIIDVFGVGISLQDNSSDNLVYGNLAEGGLIGIEAIRGTERNAITGNVVRDNRQGIRMDKNRHNLIYRNNLIDNMVSATDNLTFNRWNASEGNFYSDYPGSDADGDGLGDQPYYIPTMGSGSSGAVDYHPLMVPWQGTPDPLTMKVELSRYLAMPVAGESTIMEDGTVLIKNRITRTLPRFRDTEPLGLERPDYVPNI